MDHDPQAPPPHHHSHHHPQQSGPPPTHAGGMMLPNSYHHHHHQHQVQHHQQANMAAASAHMMSPNSSALFHNNRLPFNSVVNTPVSKPLETLNSAFSGDGSPVIRSGDGGSGSGFSIDAAKKKRGRPRKYSPDGGNIALGLTPTPVSNAMVQVDSGGTPSSEGPSSKKHRGRPPGSGKKQLDALGNCGVGFTPHVILVKAGEDIASKIMSFSQQGPRTVCILSANGSICNVTLCQSASSGGSVTYEGRFEIISLTGSFLFSENSNGQFRTGGMSISLAGPDGRVVGGGVAGVLVAASPVQIVVGSFIADGKKPKYMPSVPESRMMHFGAPSGAASPPSQEEASSESSEGHANGHLNRAPGALNHSVQQLHNNNNNNMQQQQQQQMYSSMGWNPNSGGAKMLHH